MNEENGQADVEQDYHADHDGVWALKKRKETQCRIRTADPVKTGDE